MPIKIVLMPKASASLPTGGIRTPEIPTPKPMMMPDTRDRPLGATCWANANAGNRVARHRNPVRNASGYTCRPVL